MNAVSPANRLPPEVFSHIFSYVSASDTVSSASGFLVPRPFRDWAAVTHVCRYWREAAVASSNLWSNINTPRPELMELFLSRSGAHPLEVYAHSLPTPPNRPPLFGVLPHLNQLKCLSFQISCGMYGTDYLLEKAGVPLLERLHISGVNGDSPASYPVDWIQRLFTENTQAPRNCGSTPVIMVSARHYTSSHAHRNSITWRLS